jgi:hypothetical protein
VIEGEGVFVLSETEQTVLQGRLCEQVVAVLDGRPVAEQRGRPLPFFLGERLQGFRH